MAEDIDAKTVIERASKREAEIQHSIMELQVEREAINTKIAMLRNEMRLQHSIANAGRSRTRKPGQAAMTFDEPRLGLEGVLGQSEDVVDRDEGLAGAPLQGTERPEEPGHTVGVNPA